MYNNILPKSLILQNAICEDEFIGYFHFSKETMFQYRPDYNEIFVNACDYQKYCDEKKIVIKGVLCIVLESPHIDEFFSERLTVFSGNKTNSRPANGKTGKLLRLYLKNILCATQKIVLESDSVYGVILVNSITKQCSLGMDTKYYRDRLWLHYWLSGGKLHFLERIRKYDPKVIINCCTKGEHYKCDQKSKKYLKKIESMTDTFLLNEYNLKKKVSSINSLISCSSYKKSTTIRGIVEAALIQNIKDFDFSAFYFSLTHPSSWYASKNRRGDTIDFNKNKVFFYSKV